MLLFEGTFTSFSKKKKVKKNSQNGRNQGFPYYFCLKISGSGSITLIRIKEAQKHLDSDPQHWEKILYLGPSEGERVLDESSRPPHHGSQLTGRGRGQLYLRTTHYSICKLTITRNLRYRTANRSANMGGPQISLCKSQICKLAELWFAYRYPIFLWFADLKHPQVRKYILFLLKNIEQNAVIKICTNKKNHVKLKRILFRTVLRQSYAVFCRNLRMRDLRIYHENLRICDLRTIKKSAFPPLFVRQT
jgi:hypothetical protein